MKNKTIIKYWIKNNKTLLFLVIFLVLFPIAVGVIYALPWPQIVAVDSGDLLAYYGTVFGVMGSFITYRYEINKKKKEKRKELRPTFLIEVVKTDKEAEIFNIDITNYSEQILSFLYLYDEFVSTRVQKKYSFKVTYNKTIEETNIINPDYNIIMDSEEIDIDGYPKYVQLLCDDKDGNAWNCCYYKIKDCNKIYYYPRDFEII